MKFEYCFRGKLAAFNKPELPQRAKAVLGLLAAYMWHLTVLPSPGTLGYRDFADTRLIHTTHTY